MTTQEDFMQGTVRIKVDLPGLKAELQTARNLIKSELGDAGKLKPAIGAGSGAAVSAMPAEARRSQNEATARRLRLQSLVEQRAVTRELGRPVTRQVRLDARAYRRQLKALVSDPKLNQQRVDVELRVKEKVHRSHMRGAIGNLTNGPQQGSGLGRMFGRSMVGSRIGMMAAAGPAGLTLDGAAAGATAAIGAYTAVSSKIASDGLARLATVEKYKSSLAIVLRDQKKANALFAELEALEIKLPIGLDSMAKSAQQLAGAGFDPSKISGFVESIANVGSLGTEGLDESVRRITRAITQIKSKGKLEMEDLNQIAELGIPIRQIIKEQFGMSSDELRDDIAAGATTMDAAVEGILNAFSIKYAGALEAQGNTMAGQIDKLQNAYMRFAGEASKPLFDSLQFGIENVLDLLKGGGLDTALDPIVNGINIAAGAVVVLSANLDKFLTALEGNQTFGKFSAILSLAGARGESLVTRAKGKLEEERIMEQFAEAQKVIKERERRDALTPAERAAEDEKKRQRELADQKFSDFKAAKDAFEKRTGEDYTGGNQNSKDGEALISDFRTRRDFQGVLDRVNEANGSDLKYDDFTESEREKMRGRDAKNKQEKQKRDLVTRRAAAAGLTVEEFESGMTKSQRDTVLGGARGALGLVGRGLSAASGALGGIIPGIDAATGGAASAVGGAFTMSNQDTFDRASEKLKELRAEAIANATTPEAKAALEGMQMDLRGFETAGGGLKLELDTEALERKDFSSQGVGFGDLNQAIQDKIDQAAQIKYAKETAKNTETMKEKIVAFLDSLQGTNNAPKFNSPLGP